MPVENPKGFFELLLSNALDNAEWTAQALEV